MRKGFASIILILVIVLVVGAAGAFFFLRKPTNGAPQSPIQQASNALDKAVSKQMQKSSFEVGEAKLIFTGGYADPTVLPTQNGYIMYLNNFSVQPATYEAHVSTDGVTWTKTTAKLPNASTGRAVRFGTQTRLYYPDVTPIRPTDPPASILSAISSDGLNFTKESGTRVDPLSGYYVEGPTVFQLKDSTYRMLFSENDLKSAEKRISKIWGASSSDGLTWTRDSSPTLEADGKVEKLPSADWPQALHPFVLTRSDGSYLMFYNTHSEVYAAESTDGKTWTKLGDVGIHGADVDGYYQADGSIRLYYGDFSEQTLGVVYTVVVKEVK